MCPAKWRTCILHVCNTLPSLYKHVCMFFILKNAFLALSNKHSFHHQLIFRSISQFLVNHLISSLALTQIQVSKFMMHGDNEQHDWNWQFVTYAHPLRAQSQHVSFMLCTSRMNGRRSPLDTAPSIVLDRLALRPYWNSNWLIFST